MWTCHGWVCRCCRPSANTKCRRIMVVFVVDVVGQYTKHVIVIRLDLSFLSSVSKHNMWTYHGWACHCSHLSVNTICGRNKVGLIVVVVRQ